MKVYACPGEVAAPKVDYFNYDRNKVAEAERQHQKDLKAWAAQAGFTGKNTGRILRTSYADGYALYMMVEGRTSFLIHLPYGDGYDDPLVRGLTKKAVLEEIARAERMDAYFARKTAERATA